MDFIDRLKTLSGSAHARVPHTRTEEATKTALVMPFLQVLGYDVFDPREVVPEYVADVGLKRGEKVDYAVLKDGEPIIIIECKGVGSKLDLTKVTQLFRYFTSTSARFGILTDGMIYRFFSDLEERNKMDQVPFLEFDLSEITTEDAQNLKRFTRDSFDLEDSIVAAENLKYTEAIKRVLGDMLARPTQDFVRFIMDHVHGGLKTKARVEKFRGLTKHAFREFINDRINDRLQSALESERDDDDTSEPEAAADEPTADELSTKRRIVTTEEELQAHTIVKALLEEVVDEDRVHLQDRQNYCNIVLDGSRYKNIVRLRFNGPTKRISIKNEDDEYVTYTVDSPEGIGAHAEVIRARVERLLR